MYGTFLKLGWETRECEYKRQHNRSLSNRNVLYFDISILISWQWSWTIILQNVSTEGNWEKVQSDFPMLLQLHANLQWSQNKERKEEREGGKQGGKVSSSWGHLDPSQTIFFHIAHNGGPKVLWGY